MVVDEDLNKKTTHLALFDNVACSLIFVLLNENTVKTHKFKVLGARGFISDYQYFEL